MITEPISFRWLLRSCSHCGLSLGVRKIFCEHCWEHLLPWPSICYKTSYFRDKFFVYSLFNWDHGEAGEQVGSLVRFLKGGYEMESFMELSLNFLQLRQLSSIEKNVVIIASPPREGLRFDHASEWAQALSTHTGLPLEMALKRTNDDLQKKKSRKDRLKSSNLTKITKHNYKKVVFVDDVVTTGSTALNAYYALGEPEFFEVWAIACRPSLFLV